MKTVENGFLSRSTGKTVLSWVLFLFLIPLSVVQGLVCVIPTVMNAAPCVHSTELHAFVALQTSPGLLFVYRHVSGALQSVYVCVRRDVVR